MKQINIRIGKCPYTDKFESTINGVNKPFKETLKIADEMFKLREGNLIVIGGELYTIIKVLFEGDRIIAEAYNTHN